MWELLTESARLKVLDTRVLTSMNKKGFLGSGLLLFSPLPFFISFFSCSPLLSLLSGEGYD